MVFFSTSFSKYDKFLYHVFLIKFSNYFNVINKLNYQDVFFKSKQRIRNNLLR